MIVPQKHHRPTFEFRIVEWTCRRRQCCTYARLKPFPQSAHLYARSLSSVLKRKHYCILEELQYFAYGTLDVGLGGPLSHRSCDRRSIDALADGGWPQGFQSSENCSPCLLSVRVDCRYRWVVVADRRLRRTSYCSSSYRKRVELELTPCDTSNHTLSSYASIAAVKAEQPIARVILVRRGGMGRRTGWWRALPHDSALARATPFQSLAEDEDGHVSKKTHESRVCGSAPLQGGSWGLWMLRTLVWVYLLPYDITNFIDLAPLRPAMSQRIRRILRHHHSSHRAPLSRHLPGSRVVAWCLLSCTPSGSHALSRRGRSPCQLR